jgi:hypothetical protein
MTSKALDHLAKYPAETLDETTLRYAYDMALAELHSRHAIRSNLSAEQASSNWDTAFVEDDLDDVQALLLILTYRRRRANDLRASWLLNANDKET